MAGVEGLAHVAGFDGKEDPEDGAAEVWNVWPYTGSNRYTINFAPRVSGMLDIRNKKSRRSRGGAQTTDRQFSNVENVELNLGVEELQTVLDLFTRSQIHFLILRV